MSVPCYYRLVTPTHDVAIHSLECHIGRNSKNVTNRGPDIQFVPIGDSTKISRHHITIQWDSSKRVWQLRSHQKSALFINKLAIPIKADSERATPEKFTSLPITLDSHRPSAIAVTGGKVWFVPPILEGEGQSKMGEDN